MRRWQAGADEEAGDRIGRAARARAGNIATLGDRIFISQHELYNPPHTVVEVIGNETWPFAQGAVDSVLGIARRC